MELSSAGGAHVAANFGSEESSSDQNNVTLLSYADNRTKTVVNINNGKPGNPVTVNGNNRQNRPTRRFVQNQSKATNNYVVSSSSSLAKKSSPEKFFRGPFRKRSKSASRLDAIGLSSSSHNINSQSSSPVRLLGRSTFNLNSAASTADLLDEVSSVSTSTSGGDILLPENEITYKANGENVRSSGQNPKSDQVTLVGFTTCNR